MLETDLHPRCIEIIKNSGVEMEVVIDKLSQICGYGHCSPGYETGNTFFISSIVELLKTK